uniref:Uncharacterized protein LOC114326829 n=1 Tax=Diabrotica virgifera virgifera TaxID=50390 RepID=A0A6P7F8G2_DIAVI
MLSWDALPELYDSDHYPIIIHNEEASTAIPEAKWNLKNVDWTKFQNQIERNLHAINENSNVNEEVDFITKLIIDSAEKNIGKTNFNSKFHPVPWWNHECKQAIQQSKKAFNKFKR